MCWGGDTEGRAKRESQVRVRSRCGWEEWHTLELEQTREDGMEVSVPPSVAELWFLHVYKGL